MIFIVYFVNTLHCFIADSWC